MNAFSSQYEKIALADLFFSAKYRSVKGTNVQESRETTAASKGELR
jgi:hypothetical protein